MSVQFGRWNFEGQTPAPDYIEKVSAALAPYGPDSNESFSQGGVKILYRAFHTTKESRREMQPCISPSGAVIAWDGRLDNRADLIGELCDSLTVNSTDVAIVAAAYEKWGTNCLGKLIGDWALSLWNTRERSVLLAKDPIGTKHLYYSFDDKHVTWSTILDPLVLFAGKPFKLCEEYIAGWFAIKFPAAHLTPHVGIYSVPASSSVILRPGKHVVNKYWDFDPGKRILYRTNAEYEEHFRSALTIAVQRRLRSDRPVLAELSGGIDSSSIVCMADLVIARGTAECPRLDTISWFDDSYDHIEPDTNERHWFTKVEEKRCRTGWHIDIRALKQREENEHNSQTSFGSEFETDRFAATPISNRLTSEFVKQYAECLRSQGNRVTLSGIGGSEFLGDGVPTPRQEFQDLLATTRFLTLSRQLKAWAAKMRKPRLPLLWEAMRGFFSPASTILQEDIRACPWFYPGFVSRNRAALGGYQSRVKLFGALPSFQDNIDTLEYVRRLQEVYVLSPKSLYEKRYPYLDSELLEFVFAIPREQIVGVGQRRYLAKRALVGIIPGELLNRRKKAAVPQEPKKPSPIGSPSLLEIGQHIVGGAVGIIAPDRFLKAVQKAQHNKEVPVDCLRRTLLLESWLRHLATRGVLTTSVATKRKSYSSAPETQGFQMPSQPQRFS